MYLTAICLQRAFTSKALPTYADLWLCCQRFRKTSRWQRKMPVKRSHIHPPSPKKRSNEVKQIKIPVSLRKTWLCSCFPYCIAFAIINAGVEPDLPSQGSKIFKYCKMGSRENDYYITRYWIKLWCYVLHWCSLTKHSNTHYTSQYDHF